MVVRRKSGKGDAKNKVSSPPKCALSASPDLKALKAINPFFWIIRHFQNKAIIFSPEECFGDSHLLNYFTCLGPVLGWWDYSIGVEFSTKKKKIFEMYFKQFYIVCYQFVTQWRNQHLHQELHFTSGSSPFFNLFFWNRKSIQTQMSLHVTGKKIPVCES